MKSGGAGDPPTVAVIGAGIAGLSCATALREAGIAVRVFEKSRGAGGRMATRRGEDWSCDHGAQYFTARHPDFVREVERWCAAGVAARWAPVLRALASATLRETDPAVMRFVGMPGMSAPVRHLADALDPQYACTIGAMARGDAGFRLSGAESGAIDGAFAAVAVAVPAPQAARLLRDCAPGLASLAGGVAMRGCWSLMLRYGAPLALPFDAAFVNEGPLAWVARNAGKPGREGAETWVLHAGPEWSEAHLEDDAEAVATALLAAFARLGAGVPQAWTAHRWRYALADPPLESGCAWDARLGVGLCGDWLNGGRVEGAWLSGRELAARLAASLVPGALPPWPGRSRVPS
jgi:predicted NAD/FAD-dependent oxidoreductase